MMTIFGAFDPTETNWSRLALTIGLVAVGTTLLLWGRKNLQGTTLMPSWGWAFFSLWMLAVPTAMGVLAFDAATTTWRDPWRLIAAATTFCPGIATMGARRPHLGVWQFVVLTLWGILVLPALETLILHPHQPLQVQQVRKWFLLILIVVSSVNVLPTRYWPSALLLAAGQILLLARHLPLPDHWLYFSGEIFGFSLCVTAASLAALGLPARRKTPTPMDRLWIDFRDHFGAVWALRYAEDINATAARNDLNLTLTWSGFRTAEGAPGEIPSERLLALRPYLENLLRRFVSPPWIADRLEENVD